MSSPQVIVANRSKYFLATLASNAASVNYRENAIIATHAMLTVAGVSVVSGVSGVSGVSHKFESMWLTVSSVSPGAVNYSTIIFIGLAITYGLPYLWPARGADSKPALSPRYLQYVTVLVSSGKPVGDNAQRASKRD